MKISDYIFPAVDANFKYYVPLVTIFVVILVLSLMIRALKRRFLTKKMLVRLFFNWSIFGLIIYLFRYEDVVYFGSDNWIYVLHIVGLAWLVWIIIWGIAFAPKIKKIEKVINIKEKYLPKPKHIGKRS